MYASYNGMLCNKELTRLHLVPEGLEGVAVLPGGMASVPAYTFSRCIKLSAIHANTTGGTGDAHLTSRNGFLYSADGATLLAAPAGLGASARIDANTAHVAEGAFWGNTDLKSIIVEGTVESIARGANAADSAEALAAFNPDTVAAATIALATDNAEAAKGAWLEAGFANYAQAPRPGDAIQPTEGSGFAFTLADDYTLAIRWEGADPAPADLTIPAYGTLAGMSYDVTAIAAGGFANQPQLHTVALPDTVTTIGEGAFEGCAQLQGATLGANITTIGARAFANTALKSLVLPAACAFIGEAAFDGLTDATLVAVGMVADVHPAALGASENLSVYVPYRETEDYAWQVGVPTTGNHLYPYGVRLNSEVFDLEAGQSANLYDNGGYLHAPGDIKVTCSYKASSINVDVESGQVEAKQSGSTNIDIKLILPITESVVEGRVNTDAKLEAAAFAPRDVRLVQATGETGMQVSEGTIDMDLASASKPSTVTGEAANQYSADVPVTRMKSGAKINHISVTAPLQVTFADADNDGNGLDVSQALPTEALTTVATFTNHSPDFGVSLAGVKVRDNAVSSLFQARSGAPAIGDQELVKVSNDKETISWKPSADEMTTSESTAKNFKVKKGASADWNISLNLTQADLTDAAKENANGSTTNFATLVWVFQAMVVNVSLDDANGSEDDDFYLKITDTTSPYNGNVYSIEDVTHHAWALENSEAADDEYQPIADLYKSFISTGNGYECKVKMGENLWELKVLDLLKDVRASDESPVGITFGFAEAIYQTIWKSVTPPINYSYWSRSAIRSSLNSVYIKEFSESVQNAITQVQKRYTSSGSSISFSSDKLFLPSRIEVGFSSNIVDGLGSTGREGYEYYSSPSRRVKHYDSRQIDWWLRTSGNYTYADQYYATPLYVSSSGSQYDYELTSHTQKGVSPCFCIGGVEP